MGEKGRLQPKAQSLEPDKGMSRKMGKATQAQSFSHQPQVLQYSPLFDGRKFIHPALHKANRPQPAGLGVIIEMASFRTGKFSQPCRLVVTALIDHEIGKLFTKSCQQNIDVEAR